MNYFEEFLIDQITKKLENKELTKEERKKLEGKRIGIIKSSNRIESLVYPKITPNSD